jgi:uncharacterized Zn finger protein
VACAPARVTLSLERGQRYAAEGRVRAVDEDETTIAGTVAGSHDYEVRIWVEDDDLAYACDCPIGVDGEFCKHLVALAIAGLDQLKAGPSQGPSLGPLSTGHARSP